MNSLTKPKQKFQKDLHVLLEDFMVGLKNDTVPHSKRNDIILVMLTKLLNDIVDERKQWLLDRYGEDEINYRNIKLKPVFSVRPAYNNARIRELKQLLADEINRIKRFKTDSDEIVNTPIAYYRCELEQEVLSI